MRVGLDATPLLGQPTGVGRHVAGLLTGFATLDEPAETRLVAFTWRGRSPLAGFAGPRVVLARHRAPARLLRACWQATGAPPVELLSGSVDVFHATNFVLPPTRRARGVLTVHDLAFLDQPDTLHPASLAYRKLVPAGLARADVVCAPTRVVADALASRFGLDPTRVVVTPNGLDERWLAGVQPFAPGWLAERQLPPEYLLFVGTQEPRKNLPVLLTAHRELPGAPPLVLAGPAGWGPRPPADHRVRRTGYLEDAQLARLVAGARLLVLPSAAEGFGLTALEAFACGVPVVCSDLPALREVLGDLAAYATPGDPAALHAALGAALRQPPGLGAGDRRARAQEFTWPKAAQAALRAYRLALELDPRC